jgi:acyl dehydratase
MGRSFCQKGNSMPALYLDDFKEGDEYTTLGRTMTENDIMQFAGLTADYNQIHTNEHLMKDSQFGGRIAHGLLGLSIGFGLMMRGDFLDGSSIAFLGVDEWRFLGPIRIGDTIRAKYKVLKVTPSRSKPDRGVVSYYTEIVNQDDQVAQSGVFTLMVMRKA